MAITLDGPSKIITLDTATSFNSKDVYDAAVDWSALSANMQYLIPMTGSGKAPLGGGVYTDIIYILSNGWKLKPSGYGANIQITINGTLITSDSSVRAVAPTSGSPVQWLFNAATAGTLTSTSADVAILQEIMRKELIISKNS